MSEQGRSTGAALATGAAVIAATMALAAKNAAREWITIRTSRFFRRFSVQLCWLVTAVVVTDERSVRVGPEGKACGLA
jgi:hypothetical protein